MKPVTVHQAKTHLSRLLDRAHAGEEIIIAKGTRPYARLVPLEGHVKRAPGTLRDQVELRPEFFDELPTEWTGES